MKPSQIKNTKSPTAFQKKKKKIHQSFLPKISQLVNSRPPTLILRTIAPIHCLRSQLPTASQITHQHFGFSTSRSNHCSQSHTSRIGWGMFIDLLSLIWYLSLRCVVTDSRRFFNFHEILLFSLSLISPWSLASFSWIELW